jgi:hypothetical protein
LFLYQGIRDCIQKAVKSPIKIACLLLSLILLLNGAGFAAMLNCDQACCQSASSPPAPDNHMSCHDDEEMTEMQSEPAIQVASLPATPPPQNSMQCGSAEIASSLDPKRDFRDELYILHSPAQALLVVGEDLRSQSIAGLFPLALSPQISCPLLS